MTCVLRLLPPMGEAQTLSLAPTLDPAAAATEGVKQQMEDLSVAVPFK